MNCKVWRHTEYQQARIAAGKESGHLHLSELCTTSIWFDQVTETTFTHLCTIEHKGSLWLHKQKNTGNRGNLQGNQDSIILL